VDRKLIFPCFDVQGQRSAAWVAIPAGYFDPLVESFLFLLLPFFHLLTLLRRHLLPRSRVHPAHVPGPGLGTAHQDLGSTDRHIVGLVGTIALDDGMLLLRADDESDPTRNDRLVSHLNLSLDGTRRPGAAYDNQARKAQ